MCSLFDSRTSYRTAKVKKTVRKQPRGWRNETRTHDQQPQIPPSAVAAAATVASVGLRTPPGHTAVTPLRDIPPTFSGGDGASGIDTYDTPAPAGGLLLRPRRLRIPVPTTGISHRQRRRRVGMGTGQAARWSYCDRADRRVFRNDGTCRHHGSFRCLLRTFGSPDRRACGRDFDSTPRCCPGCSGPCFLFIRQPRAWMSPEQRRQNLRERGECWRGPDFEPEKIYLGHHAGGTWFSFIRSCCRAWRVASPGPRGGSFRRRRHERSHYARTRGPRLFFLPFSSVRLDIAWQDCRDLAVSGTRGQPRVSGACIATLRAIAAPFEKV